MSEEAFLRKSDEPHMLEVGLLVLDIVLGEPGDGGGQGRAGHGDGAPQLHQLPLPKQMHVVQLGGRRGCGGGVAR